MTDDTAANIARQRHSNLLALAAEQEHTALLQGQIASLQALYDLAMQSRADALATLADSQARIAKLEAALQTVMKAADAQPSDGAPLRPAWVANVCRMALW